MPRPVANIVRAWVYDAPHGADNFGGGCVVNEDLRCYRVRSELACREIVHRTPPDGEGQARSQARPTRGERPRKDHCPDDEIVAAVELDAGGLDVPWAAMSP